MSENNERIINKEEKEAERVDFMENAPAEPEQPAPKKAKKKKRGNGVALPLVAVLTAAALVFGVVVGYGIGRSALLERVAELQADLDELQAQSQALSADVGEYDAFEEAITGENAADLSALSGESLEGENSASALLGEEGLGGADSGDLAGVIVVEYQGGTISAAEAVRAYDERMAQLAFEGVDGKANSAGVLEQVLRELVAQRLLEAYAQEKGLNKLTAEDQQEIEERAGAEFAARLEETRAQVNGEGMTDAEINGAAKLLLQEEGVTLESLQAEMEDGWWQEKVYEAITSDAGAEEAALQTAYDALVQQQKEAFEAYPADFEFAQRSGETIAYRLPGYRAVKVLQFNVDEAALTRIAEIESRLPEAAEAEAKAMNAELDAIYADAEAHAREALLQLEGGAELEGAVEMYVSLESDFWPQAVKDAAFAFAQVGERSEVLRTGDGACILEYVGEVAEGPVPMEALRESLMQQALLEAKDAAYQAQIDAWISEAKPSYYPDRMQ